MVHSTECYLPRSDRTELLSVLHEAQRRSRQLVDDVPDRAWFYVPAPDRWSVGQIAEHLLIAESILFNGAKGAVEAPFNPRWQAATLGKTDTVRRVVGNRDVRVPSPSAAVPTGILSRREVIDPYVRARAVTIDFVEDVDGPILAHTSDHFMWGVVSAYHWLLHLALHNVRHNEQMVEVLKTPGFPR